MKLINFVIVGCGSVSSNRYFPNLNKLHRGQLAAICDTNEELARPYAKQFGVPLYTDFDAMLKNVDFDLLVNLTSMNGHFPINLKALQAGKHVYTQKPMTRTMKKATILIEEAARRNLKLVSAEAYILTPVYATIRQLVQQNTLGKIYWARSRCTHWGPACYDYSPTTAFNPAWKYQKGAGPLRMVGIERLQCLTGILGPAQRVTAMSGINQREVVVEKGVYKGQRIKVDEDDTTMVTLDFGNSTFAMLDAVWLPVWATRVPDLEIYGSKGVLSLFGGHPKMKGESLIELYRKELDLGIRGWTEVELITKEKHLPPMGVLGLAHAMDCVLDDLTPVLSGEYSRHCIEIIEKAFVAARTGMTQTIESRFDFGKNNAIPVEAGISPKRRKRPEKGDKKNGKKLRFDPKDLKQLQGA